MGCLFLTGCPSLNATFLEKVAGPAVENCAGIGPRISARTLRVARLRQGSDTVPRTPLLILSSFFGCRGHSQAFAIFCPKLCFPCGGLRLCVLCVLCLFLPGGWRPGGWRVRGEWVLFPSCFGEGGCVFGPGAGGCRNLGWLAVALLFSRVVSACGAFVFCRCFFGSLPFRLDWLHIIIFSYLKLCCGVCGLSPSS